KIIDLIVDEHGNPLALGRTRRLATYSQRLALAARDRGCVKPGCTTPAVRTEAHHITAWADGGRTDINQMALLCGPDHDTIAGCVLVPSASATPVAPMALVSVSGHVTDAATGDPVADVCVSTRTVADHWWNERGCTDGDGHFAFDLAPGKYEVQYDPTDDALG